jgi:hypothetical protein
MLISMDGRSGSRSPGQSIRRRGFQSLSGLTGFCFRTCRNMAISGTNFTIKNTIIDAFTSGGFPFNTDGFDIKSVG